MAIGSIDTMGNYFASGESLKKVRLIFSSISLFLVFFIGLAIVTFLLPPIIISTKKRRPKRMRWIIQQSFRLFIRAGSILGIFDVSVLNHEKLCRRGEVIIANHPSLLDAIILLSLVPNANCVVKKSLFRNPLLAGILYFTGYIRSGEGAELLRGCLDCLARGESIIIFPEGTRTRPDQSYTFKRGVAHLMLLADNDIRPVYISCAPPLLRKQDPWYATPERKVHFRLTVLNLIPIQPIRDAERLKLSRKSRLLTNWLIDWYREMDNRGPFDPARIELAGNKGVDL